MDFCLLGLFVLLIFVFAARAILKGANEDLTKKEREKLISLFTWSGIYNITRLLLLLMLFFLSFNIKYFSTTICLIAYILAVGTLLVTSCYRACNKLKRAHFSSKYIKAYISSIVLKTLGLVLFFVFIIIDQY